MKPSELTWELEACLRANLVANITGPPATGKSDVAHQTIDRMNQTDLALQLEGWGDKDIRSALFDPTTLQGMPVPINKKTGLPIMGHPAYGKDKPEMTTRFAPFDFWPTWKQGVIVFDEFTSATPAQQAMYYQVLWGGRLGETEIPPGTRFILIGNRVIDRAYTNRMSTANNSRVVHLPFEIDNDDWHNWAVAKPLDARVIFYHKWRAYQWLYRFDPAKDDAAFPAPRPWEMTSRYLKSSDIVFKGKPHGSRFQAIKGIVGEPAAVDFCGFIDILDKMIDPDLVLLKPDTVELPTDPMVIMALCGAIANRAVKANMNAVCTFADRLPREYSALLMWTAGKRDKALWGTSAGARWAQNHPEMLAA